jgi:hypothetical protein
MAATLANPTVVDLLSQQASDAATAATPGKVALTVIAFLFTAVGWVIGRTWWHGAKILAFTALAVRYGYRQGARIPVEPIPQTQQH